MALFTGSDLVAGRFFASGDPVAHALPFCGRREQLEVIRGLKTQLTSMATVTRSVTDGLDGLRAGILARVAEAEAELRVAAAAA